MFRRKTRGKARKGPARKVSRSIKLRLAVIITVALVAGLAGALLAIHHSIVNELPRIYALKDYKPPLGTSVFSSDDHLLGRIKAEKGIYVPISRIPDNLKYAVLAVEDAKFYRHEGLDYQGITRALVKDIASGSFREGGSTITQQLAKLMFLTPEKSIVRKLREAVLAVKMEEELTKDEILELYLNKAYFGHGAYGAEMAARAYFGKRVGDLSLAEAAVMAGLLKSPSKYSPYRDMENARERQAVVLGRMVEEGFISRGRADRAVRNEIRLDDIRDDENVAPHLVELVRVYLLDRYGPDTVYEGGLKVRTTIDYQMQRAAKAALEKGIKDIEARHGGTGSGVQGALVAIESATGRIKAMVGGVDFAKNEFNHAVFARRRPGSAFKPFLYAAAMEAGFSPASIIEDEPRTYDDGRWSPENADKQFRGPTRLREALVHSMNVVTVELLNRVGVQEVTGLAKGLGMEGPFPKDLTLALGSGSVSPVEITGAYCAFANGGMSVKPYYIEGLSTRDSRVVEEAGPVTAQVLSPAAAYQVTSMLEDVIKRGTASGATGLAFPAAGKTGTTDGYQDAWFVGYSPGLAAGVWVGYDDQKSMGPGETGARAALPVWAGFMAQAVPADSSGGFAVPDDIEFAQVDAGTGLPPGTASKEVITEAFRRGEAPEGGSWLRRLSPGNLKKWLLGD